MIYLEFPSDRLENITWDTVMPSFQSTLEDRGDKTRSHSSNLHLKMPLV